MKQAFVFVAVYFGGGAVLRMHAYGEGLKQQREKQGTSSER